LGSIGEKVVIVDNFFTHWLLIPRPEDERHSKFAKAVRLSERGDDLKVIEGSLKLRGIEIRPYSIAPPDGYPTKPEYFKAD